MTSKRLLYNILFLCCCALLACSGAKTTAGNGQLFVAHNDKNIQYEGRVGMMADAAELYWSGTTVTVRFEGTGLNVVLKDFNGQNWCNVIVDNNRIFTIKIDSAKKTYTLAQDLPAGVHTVTLFKRTQIHEQYKRGYIRLYGFELGAGGKLLSPPALKKRKIEFYGNSVTCGHAIEDTTGGDSGASLYENNYLSYAAITARHCDARYRCIAKSGIGLMVSWGPMIMPEMYDRLNPFDSTSKWDFKKYQPDIVVVNLLQNDEGIWNRPDYEHFKKRFGAQAPSADYIIQHYQQFIQQLRSHYPGAHIICALGSMGITREGSKWPGYVTQAVANLHDPKVYTHFFRYKGTPKHPLVKDHEAMAESLIAFINKTIAW
jgi:hypothetical protein